MTQHGAVLFASPHKSNLFHRKKKVASSNQTLTPKANEGNTARFYLSQGKMFIQYSRFLLTISDLRIYWSLTERTVYVITIKIYFG